jgi:hypothetical protein
VSPIRQMQRVQGEHRKRRKRLARRNPKVERDRHARRVRDLLQ